jgi:predicted DNA-binding transcriptional regulator YafY
MRADRLLSILLLLQVHRRLTAGELAERLAVSRRTIYRDLDALSAAGVPVYAERGHGGGCALLDGYHTRVPALSEAEVQALALATPARLLADLNLESAAAGADLKLLAALPPTVRNDAQHINRRILIDTAGWRQREDAPTMLPALQASVLGDRRIQMSYDRRDGNAVDRIVDPLGLVAKGSLWYLIAAVDGEPRTYRADRVRSVQPTGEVAQRPPDFDLATYWPLSQRQFLAGIPRYPVRMRVSPDVLPSVEAVGTFATIETQGEPDATGWRELEVAFQSEGMALAFAFRYVHGCEIAEPTALRERLAEAAGNTLKRYAASVSGVTCAEHDDA